MTVKFNAAEMKRICDAKISFKGNLSPVINLCVEKDILSIGIDNGFIQVVGAIKIDSVVETAINFSVHYNIFNEIIGKFGKQDIFIEVGERDITLKGGKYRFTLMKMISAYNDILGQVKNFKSEYEMVMPIEMFKDIFSKVIPFVSHTDNRPSLRGVNISFDEKDMDVAATNTKQLSRYTLDNRSTMKEGFIILDPAALSKIIDEATTDISMKWNHNSMLFAYDNIQLLSQLIGEKYPSYKKMGDGTDKSVTVPRKEMLDAINMVGIIHKGGLISNATQRINIDFNDKGARVYSDADGGNSSTDIEFDTDLKEHHIAFNSDFFRAILSLCEKDTVTMHMKDDKNPIRVEDTGNTARQYYIFMPLTNTL